jgi:hypothetical protein
MLRCNTKVALSIDDALVGEAKALIAAAEDAPRLGMLELRRFLSADDKSVDGANAASIRMLPDPPQPQSEAKHSSIA